MASIGVRLPITHNSADGFTMLKSIQSTLKQNFKMLLLTDPGDRVMDPDFGCGLRTYLFLNYSENVHEQVRSKILKQTSLYIPAISITELDFGIEPDLNKLSVRIDYTIPAIGIADLLEFTI